MTDMFLAGTATQLQAGDVILIVGDDRLPDRDNSNWDVITLTGVEPDTQTGLRTRVTWREALRTRAPAQIFAFRKRVKLFGHNAPLFKSLPKETKTAFGDDPAHPANDWSNLHPDTFTLAGECAELAGSSIATRFLDLDVTGSKIVRGSWLALEEPPPSGVQDTTPKLTDPPPPSEFPPADVRPPPFPFGVTAEPIDLPSSTPPEFDPDEDADAGLFQVTRTPVLVTRAEFALSQTVTRVRLDTFDGIVTLNRREAAFHGESELLPIGTRPVIAPVDGREVLPEIADIAVLTDDATGRFIALDGTAEGLTPGRRSRWSGSGRASGSSTAPRWTRGCSRAFRTTSPPPCGSRSSRTSPVRSIRSSLPTTARTGPRASRTTTSSCWRRPSRWRPWWPVASSSKRSRTRSS